MAFCFQADAGFQRIVVREFFGNDPAAAKAVLSRLEESISPNGKGLCIKKGSKISIFLYPNEKVRALLELEEKDINEKDMINKSNYYEGNIIPSDSNDSKERINITLMNFHYCEASINNPETKTDEKYWLSNRFAFKITRTEIVPDIPDKMEIVKKDKANPTDFAFTFKLDKNMNAHKNAQEFAEKFKKELGIDPYENMINYEKIFANIIKEYGKCTYLKNAKGDNVFSIEAKEDSLNVYHCEKKPFLRKIFNENTKIRACNACHEAARLIMGKEREVKNTYFAFIDVKKENRITNLSVHFFSKGKNGWAETVYEKTSLFSATHMFFSEMRKKTKGRCLIK